MRSRLGTEATLTVQKENHSQLSDQEISNLVSGLDNLRWNFQVQTDIMTLGPRAVPALVTFLHGSPSQFPDGRVLAAEILGRIGGEAAFEGLLNALSAYPLEHLSPVLRLAEETVQDAVALQLGRIGDRRAIPALLDALHNYRLLGAAEALVSFHEQNALPWLVQGLEDAFKRDRLAQAILDMGWTAILYLIDTLEQRKMHGDEELLPSVERRAEALRLLGLLYAKEAAPALRTALGETSGKIRMEAALAMVAVDASEHVLEAVPALLAGLTHPDFLQRDRCADALVCIGPRCVPLLNQAIARGGIMVGPEAVPLTVTARAAVLAVLERLKGRAAC
jgi:HEAT repeat protein